MEQQEKQDKSMRKLKKQLKFYIKTVEDFEGNHLALTVHTLYFLDDISTALILWFSYVLHLANAQQKSNPSVTNAPLRAVNITRKEKEYKGMLEYRQSDVSRLLKSVVTGMFYLFFLK